MSIFGFSRLSWVQATSLSSLLWVVVPMSVLFSKPFQWYTALSWVCSTQWSLLVLGSSLSCLCMLLGSDSHVRSSGVGPGFHVLWGHFLWVPLSMSPWYFMVSEGSLFQSSSQKVGLNYPILLCLSHNCTSFRGPSSGRMKGEKNAMGLIPSSDCRGRLPPSASQVPMGPAAATTMGLLGAWDVREQRKQRKWGISSTLSEHQESPFPVCKPA